MDPIEETESVLLNINLGKCSKPKDTHKPRMQKREKPSQREVYRCPELLVYTLVEVKTVELVHTSQSQGGV